MRLTLLAIPLICCCQASRSLAQNTAAVEFNGGAQDRSADRPTEFKWSRTFTAEDAQRLFKPGVPRNLQTTLKCDVASDGRLKNCERERAPDLPQFQYYYEAVERSFVVSRKTLMRTPALWVFVNVSVINSAGADVKPYSCLSAFCTSTPAPPPVFKGEGCSPAVPLWLKCTKPRFPPR